MNYLEIALEAAIEAGKISATKFRNNSEVIKYKKYYRDIVTKTDVQIEEKIKEIITQHFPSHSFVGEETGIAEATSDYKWIIDPIDGTVNFKNGIPLYCTSIALVYKKDIILGVIHNPELKEMFVAEKGKGAKLNEKRIQVFSKTNQLSDSTFAVGFKGGGTKLKEYQAFYEMNESTRGVLRTGSAALNLAYVAAGRLTGFWSKESPPWDVAAGVILVREAGGKISDFQGKEYVLGNELLASNGMVHAQAQKLLENIFI